MSIIRVQRPEKYTTVSNVHINDDRLSWKATALLTYLLSKPNDWTVYIKQLAKAKKDGIKAVYSGIKELKECGYIEHVFIRGEDGKMHHGEYIVHEEPIAIGKPVNTDPEPYTQKGDTVNGNTDNGTLLNTEVKLNTDDDKTEPPPPEPKDSPKVDPSEPSPSFSENDLIQVLASLMTLVPEALRKPSVEHVIKSALEVNTPDYIRAAIAYTIANSTGGTLPKFKAYLGRAIDLAWAVGWEPETDQATGPDLDAVREQFMKMTDQNLRFMASAGNRFAIAEIERRAGAGN